MADNRGLRRLLRVPRPLREQVARDVDDEVSFHLAMRIAELKQEGLSAAAASAQAELEFGDVTQARRRLVQDASKREREVRRGRRLDELMQDLRYGWRMVRQQPGFSAVVIATLALGIAATTTIFTVYEGILLRALPFAEAERVVVPKTTERGSTEDWAVSYADFLDWQNAGVFEHVAVFQPQDADVRLGDEPERVSLVTVTSGFFPALGARPQLGRVLNDGDFAPDAPRALVISHELWQTRFGGTPDVIGRTIGSVRPGTIVGVLPASAAWPTEGDLWVPLALPEGAAPPSDWLQRDNYVFGGIARLKPGVTLAQTRAHLDALARIVEKEIPAERANVTVTALPLRQEMLGNELPRALVILMVAVVFVLLIGCANIANLMLARGAGRRREFAVRTALGARPWRIARQLLTESIVMGIVGGLLGLVLARWGVQLLTALAPANVPRLDQIALNGRVLAIGAIASIGAALLFGLAPALQAMRIGTAETLSDTSARNIGTRQGNRVRRSLVVVELALSVMLLIGAGLLMRSLLHLQQVDPGFRTSNLVTVSLNLGRAHQGEDAQIRFFELVTERARALPGVTNASIASAQPLGAGGFYLGRAFLAEGWSAPPAGPEVSGMWNVVGPAYFSTMEIPLLRGREFTARDDKAATQVAIINESFAKRMFQEENPIGKRFKSWRDENVLREVVGVVKDVRYFGAGDELRPLVYVPMHQGVWSSMVLTVRTRGDVAPMLAALRSELRTLDPALAMANVTTMEDARTTSLAQPRFNTMLLGAFAVLALLLAAIGIYGVIAHGVSQRTREFGVRLALGANPRDLVRLVIREATLLITAGVGSGVLAALVGARAMQSLLFELDWADPITFAAVAVLLAGIALLASWLPARRATAVGPLEALRQ